MRPEDIILDNNFNLKLCDYGIQNAIINSSPKLKWVKDVYQKNTSLSPEIIKLIGATEKSDIFNLGVILFSMVIGFRPFKEMNPLSDIFYKLIQEKNPKKYWQIIEKNAKINVSQELKDLIFKMLALDSSDRIGIEEILSHPWILNDDIPNCHFIANYFNQILDSNKKINKNIKNENKNVILYFAKTLFENLEKEQKKTISDHMKRFFVKFKNND